jgi:peroxiredoxin
MIALLDEMGAVEPRTRGQVRVNRQEAIALMALLGDADAVNTLKKAELSPDRDEVASASAWILMINWDKARSDPPAQEKLAGDFMKLAQARPYSDVMAQVASAMIEAASTRVLADRLETLVVDTLNSPKARDMSGYILRARKLRSLVGRPLDVQGQDVGGKPFSTAPWKGRVVLVQFWVTGAEQCVAQLPMLQKLYADQHKNGLEILGVTSDSDVTNFQAFLGNNPGMPWPQLIDPTTQDVHPLLKQYGIDEIPQLFLIDRRGVIRSVDAIKDLTTLLPKLMAEPAP